jgi:lipopolysaccharide biosynthesis regulator YciM
MNTNTSISNHQAILNAAEGVAHIYGDTETAHRLMQLASEARDADDGATHGEPLPICSICGGNVNVRPRVRCQECGFLFSP